jgi:hypothetical protein
MASIKISLGKYGQQPFTGQYCFCENGLALFFLLYLVRFNVNNIYNGTQKEYKSFTNSAASGISGSTCTKRNAGKVDTYPEWNLPVGSAWA